MMCQGLGGRPPPGHACCLAGDQEQGLPLAVIDPHQLCAVRGQGNLHLHTVPSRVPSPLWRGARRLRGCVAQAGCLQCGGQGGDADDPEDRVHRGLYGTEDGDADLGEARPDDGAGHRPPREDEGAAEAPGCVSPRRPGWVGPGLRPLTSVAAGAGQLAQPSGLHPRRGPPPGTLLSA